MRPLPTPVMLHIKFDQDWPTGSRDIQILMCGRRTTTNNDGPLVYYKLTLRAFVSGELKAQNILGKWKSQTTESVDLKSSVTNLTIALFV